MPDRQARSAAQVRKWGHGDPSVWGSVKELAWSLTHEQRFLFAVIVFCLTMAVLGVLR